MHGTHGFVIVSKDEDFHRLGVLHGPPPKVIWVRSGNCTTELVETLLRRNYDEIIRFEGHAEVGFLELG